MRARSPSPPARRVRQRIPSSPSPSPPPPAAPTADGDDSVDEVEVAEVDEVEVAKVDEVEVAEPTDVAESTGRNVDEGEVAKDAKEPNEVVEELAVLMKGAKLDDTFPCRVCGDRYKWLVKDSGIWLCTYCQNKLWQEFADAKNLTWWDWDKDGVKEEFATLVASLRRDAISPRIHNIITKASPS